MIRSCLFLLSLPCAVALAQRAPIHVLVSSPNEASFEISMPSTDSGRGPIVGRGRLDYLVETGNVLRVRSWDSPTSVHVDATQDGRVIASGEGAYVVVHSEPTGAAIEVRSQIPPSVVRRSIAAQPSRDSFDAERTVREIFNAISVRTPRLFARSSMTTCTGSSPALARSPANHSCSRGRSPQSYRWRPTNTPSTVWRRGRTAPSASRTTDSATRAPSTSTDRYSFRVRWTSSRCAGPLGLIAPYHFVDRALSKTPQRHRLGAGGGVRWPL